MEVLRCVAQPQQLRSGQLQPRQARSESVPQAVRGQPRLNNSEARRLITVNHSTGFPSDSASLCDGSRAPAARRALASLATLTGTSTAALTLDLGRLAAALAARVGTLHASTRFIRRCGHGKLLGRASGLLCMLTRAEQQTLQLRMRTMKIEDARTRRTLCLHARLAASLR